MAEGPQPAGSPTDRTGERAARAGFFRCRRRLGFGWRSGQGLGKRLRHLGAASVTGSAVVSGANPGLLRRGRFGRLCWRLRRCAFHSLGRTTARCRDRRGGRAIAAATCAECHAWLRRRVRLGRRRGRWWRGRGRFCPACCPGRLPGCIWGGIWPRSGPGVSLEPTRGRLHGLRRTRWPTLFRHIRFAGGRAFSGRLRRRGRRVGLVRGRRKRRERWRCRLVGATPGLQGAGLRPICA